MTSETKKDKKDKNETKPEAKPEVKPDAGTDKGASGENNFFGKLVLVIVMNVFGCYMMKMHFQEALKDLDKHVDRLEEHTDIIYR